MISFFYSILSYFYFLQAYFDIALIELEGKELEFTMTVHPVCLPSEIPDDIDKWEGRLIDIGKKWYKGSFFNNVDLILYNIDQLS